MRRRRRPAHRSRALRDLPAGPVRRVAAADRFEAADRCVLPLVAEHTRSENPYRLIYAALGISEPGGPRTKPACCDPEGQPPVDPDLASRLKEGLAELAPALPAPGKARDRGR